MNRIRKLIADEQGESPWLVMASLTIYVIVAIAVAAALTVSLISSNTMNLNASIKQALSTETQKTVSLGYRAVEELLPATSPITLTVEGRTIAVQRVITLSTNQLTAQVTFRAGAAGAAGLATLAQCDADPALCITATELTARPRTAP